MLRKAKKIRHRIIVLGDIHATDEISYYPEVKFGGKQINSRLYYLHKIIKKIIKDLAVPDKTSFIQTGDWFDKKKVNPDTEAIVADIIKHLTDVGYVHTIRGNHDYYGDAYDHLDKFEKLNNDFVRMDKEEFIMKTGFILYGIGYQKAVENFYDILGCLSKCKHKAEKILVIHQDIIGFKFESGMKIESGVDLSKIKKEFPDSMIIGGHLHTHQFGKKGENFVAPGILLPKNFNECFSPTLLYGDIYEGEKIKWHCVNYIKHIPLFAKTKVEIINDGNTFNNNTYANPYIDVNNHHGFVRMDLYGKDAHKIDIAKYREEVLRKNKKLYYFDINVTDKKENIIETYRGENIHKVIERYVDDNIDNTDMERESLINTGRKLIND